MTATMALFAAVVIVYVCLSARAGRAYLSAPMVFMVTGFAFGSTAFYGLEGPTIKVVAEITLALLLFHGAAGLRPRDLRTEWLMTSRLLLVALPLSIAATFLLIRLLFPDLDPWFALLLGAALVPTDSALSVATVLNPVVPARIRRLLNLESGLNDGLATPVMLFALAAAQGTADGVSTGELVISALLAILVGVAFGAFGGLLCGLATREAGRRDWAEERLLPVAVLMIPLLCYYGAAWLGGNGFMAAFVSGAAFTMTQAARPAASSDLELTDVASSLLGCAAWVMFGAATATHASFLLHWQPLLVAGLSLTVLRMVPVALSMTGSGLRIPSLVFVGWFGPRGLPSVVFALIAYDALEGRPGAAAVVATIAVTVVISVIAHGLTAPPLAARYGAWAGSAAPATESA